MFLLLTFTAPVADTFAMDCLVSHNQARKLHQETPDLSWNDNIAERARNYLSSEVINGNVAPSCEKGPECTYGENIFIMEGLNSSVPIPCAFATFYWYKESIDVDYNFSKAFEEQQGDVLQFTQVMWRNTLELGCARVDDGDVWIILCQYEERGNILGSTVVSTDNVRPIREDVVLPEMPQDFMDSCQDLYREECEDFLQNCDDSWGLGTGPSVFCPETCGVCDSSLP